MDARIRQKTLRLLSNGVYIMTSRSGDRFGAATVTWVSQASFRPPLLMAAIRRESSVFRCMTESHAAALHIVEAGRQDMAQRFFSPTRAGAGLINGEPFVEGKTAAPVLQRAAAYVECRVDRVIEGGGDHAIVILEVVEAECREGVRPLTIAESPWRYGG